MKKFKLLTLAILLASGYSVSAQAALVDITLDPSDCGTTYTCFTTNDNSNLSLAEIEAITGATGLESLYKQDVGAGSDSGSFAASYETTFSNSSNDPEDAVIALIAGMDPINCGVCYLVVKDGNQDPAQYIYDLSLVGMINSISAIDFWPNQGAISHVEIVGNSDMSVIPVPAAIWLFGTALIGFIGFSRRTRV